MTLVCSADNINRCTKMEQKVHLTGEQTRQCEEAGNTGTTVGKRQGEV